MTAGVQSITVEMDGEKHAIELPEAKSDLPSIFVIGLPKAGSTLLNNLMRPLCTHAGLEPFAITNRLRRMGFPMSVWPGDISSMLPEKGYAYHGFRAWMFDAPPPAFASGHTVFLVRDPRDIVVSQYFSEGFSHVKPGTEKTDALAREFDERRAAVQAMSIDQYVRETAPSVRGYYQTTVDRLAAIDYKAWRYEDVVFEKERWVNEMLDYLGLSAPAGVISRVVERNDIRPSSEETDKHIRKVTPGDHREKLTPETIAELNELFAPILERYGYD